MSTSSHLPKIAIVGAGQVGATTAHLMLMKRLGHLVLIDIVEGMAQGKALDLLQAAAAEGLPVSVAGTTDYAAMADSRLVVVTAGFARKPGMSRDAPTHPIRALAWARRRGRPRGRSLLGPTWRTRRTE
jgi:malate/lactate dehydrogenase